MNSGFLSPKTAGEIRRLRQILKQAETDLEFPGEVRKKLASELATHEMEMMTRALSFIVNAPIRNQLDAIVDDKFRMKLVAFEALTLLGEDPEPPRRDLQMCVPNEP